VQWPDDEPCLANYLASGHRPAFTGVVADAAVISHDKVFTLGHRPGTTNAAVMSSHIRFVEFEAVTVYISHIYGAVRRHLYDLGGQADYPLDSVILGLVRCLKDDDIASIGVVAEPVGCFVYNNIFSIVQVGFHARTVDPEVLNHEMDGEEDDQSQENDL